MNTTARAVLLGAASGGRSTLGPAALAWTADPTADPPWVARLGTPWGRAATTLAAVGELAADKHPRTPSRLNPLVLGQRMATAAVTGAVLARRAGEPATKPAVCAAIAAVIAVVAGVRWRERAGQRGASALAAAVVEDLISLGLAAAAVTRRA